MNDIEDGLKHLAQSYQEMGINSIAMPALGCGLGNLHWGEVQPLIVKYLGNLPDLDVYVYEPQDSVQISSNVDKSDSTNFVANEKISAQQLTAE